MFYEFAVSVPANTTEASPVTRYLEIAHGIITGIDIQFPIGCMGLAHCRLEHHMFGSLPTNISGSFSTDGYIISVRTPIEFYQAPYDIRATLWNDDDTYPHALTIRIDEADSKAAVWFMGLMKALERFLKMVGFKA